METELNVNVKGSLKMVFRDTRTGEIIDTFEDNNVFLKQGKSAMLRAFTTLNSNDYQVRTISIGTDIGSGTVLDPELPDSDYTEANQDVIYEVPLDEFFVEYPDDESVRFLATINGVNVMSSFTTQPNVIYTSAALMNQSGEAVAYRRFSARTISSYISVDVAWTLRLI
jgi:hypothetical protein